MTVTRNTMKAFILLSALGGLFVLVGGLIASRAGALVGLTIGLLVVGGSYWFSAGIAVRSVHRPQPDLSFPAAYAARIVMMGQTRAAEYERLVAETDFEDSR